MVKRYSEHRKDVAVAMFGGSGEVQFTRIAETPEDLYGKGRVFSVVTLNKGCELGWHIHKGDGEYYHILSGEGEYSDNGDIVTLKAGDTAFCPEGEGHSIANRGDEPLVFVALVVYK